MTPEEARKIKVGDYLITKWNNKYRVVVVTRVIDSPNTVYSTERAIYVFPATRKRLDRLGNLLPSSLRRAIEVGWAPETLCRRDPDTGNVFADWLEEQGHTEAAKALRQAFPICRPELKDQS